MSLSNTGNQVRLMETLSPLFYKSIIAAGTNFQYLATQPYRVLVAVIINENIPYPDSLAKNAAAFFSISFSIFSRLFSSLRRLSSSVSDD